jgi:hypothetical protein
MAVNVMLYVILRKKWCYLFDGIVEISMMGT